MFFFSKLFTEDKCVFTIFQSQIIFPSPALQLFSRITSPPFLISLATLFFAKSKTIFKNIRKEGVSVFQIEFNYKSCESKFTFHESGIGTCETLFSIGHYCTVNPCWLPRGVVDPSESESSGGFIGSLSCSSLLSNCRHWTLHNLPSLSVNLDLTSHQKWFAWGEILLCQKERKLFSEYFIFLVFPVCMWCSNG